jgi:hypothetical protein
LVIELQGNHVSARKGDVSKSSDTNKLYTDTYKIVLASNEALLERLDELGQDLSALPFKITSKGL